MNDIANKVHNVIEPLLCVDEQGMTTDSNVAEALCVLGVVAAGLLANKEDGEDEKLMSSLWNTVTRSTKEFRERIRTGYTGTSPPEGQ